VVFFIIIVGNIGGALTPIGDPPLFLGYLRGIPFGWVTASLWPVWAVAVGMVLLIFFVLDSFGNRAVKSIPPIVQESKEGSPVVEGWHNLVFIGMIIGAFFMTRPGMVRELVMIAAAAGSYITTKPQIHRMNRFAISPLKEIAILFFGIFLTMVPALHWLGMNADRFGLVSPGGYFWATGGLSSILDNAPTYLGFLSTATGTFVDRSVTDPANQIAWLIRENNLHLMAISAGAVFFGALTYIGNGPNYMIRSVAAHAGVGTPTFTGYIFRYSLPILLPVFLVIWLLFF
jgi:Na+/H+ antiporter NhaD/arsenite permease-like protein